jgi:hypothetical protein
MKKYLLCVLFLLLVGQTFAATDFYLRKGDTGPYYYVQITDSSGAVNLSGGTVTVTMKSLTGTVKVDAAAASITSAANGYVEYQWTTTDTNWPTNFLIEFKLTLGGRIYTFPTRDTARVIIKDNFVP